MKKILYIISLVLLFAFSFSNNAYSQSCPNNTVFMDIEYIGEGGNIYGEYELYLDVVGGHFYDDYYVDFGDGTNATGHNITHQYTYPGSYPIMFSYYCDSITHYLYDTITLECPTAYSQNSSWDMYYEGYNSNIDSIEVNIVYHNNYNVAIVITSIDWGDNNISYVQDTVNTYEYGDFYIHNYAPILDSIYHVVADYYYLYDSACTYQFEQDFWTGHCFSVANNGVTTNVSDIYRARFYCNCPSSPSAYKEWYITEYGDSIYGHGTHLVYFPDTGYVNYCKYMQNKFDSTCFSYVCDSVYINGVILGCTDPNSSNYNPLANTNDSSCCGCIDSTAYNYNANANISDSSCVWLDNIFVYGGWTMISSYIQPVNSSIENMFNSLLNPYYELVVKDGLGQVYYPNFGVNQITTVSPGEGFQVRINHPTTSWKKLVVIGDKIIPEQTPIALPQGWSIVGYPRYTTGLLDSMLTDVLPNVIIMKDDQGNVYWQGNRL